ncbi:sensor histidine kinase [Nocardioides pyridinolyticus]
MKRPDRLDAAVVAGAVVAAGLAAVGLGAGTAEWVFFAALLTGFMLAIRSLVDAWQAQGRQRRRAEVARSIAPEDAAAEAVRRERARMAADTAASLREHLSTVHRLASTCLVSPEIEQVRLIHARSQQASSELRRHLGLLRDPDPLVTPTRQDARDLERPRASGPPARPRFADLVVGTAAALVALTESLVARSTEYSDRGWLTVALTTAAAFTVSWHRAAPAGASLVAAGLFLTGAVLGEGVLPGLWLLGSLGLILWGTLARRGRGWSDAGAGLTLVGVAACATMLTDPDNGRMTCAVLAVLVVVAGATGLARQVAARHAHDAGEHEATIEHASGLAVHAERTAFARELHDVVSHAVGLIAMQAAAAEVSWTTNRPGALEAVATIKSTAAATLADLDRLDPDARHCVRSLGDLEALLQRVAAAGTPVEATGLGLLPEAHLAVAYRLVQESLTNVLCHAPGARAHVEVRQDPGATLVIVSDDGPGGPASSDRGFGLVGLRERVGYAGGTLTVGPGPRGFRVEAALPHAPDPARPDGTGVAT